MILHWTIKDNAAVNKFITPMPTAETADRVWAWLESKEAKTISCTGWDADCDHDGHNSLGWRVYVEDWGHVADDWSAICAIKPVWLWHGK